MSRSIETARTAGGIPVVVESDTESMEAGIIVAVATGSRDEAPEVCGISRLLGAPCSIIRRQGGSVRTAHRPRHRGGI